jgi:hypothetical protein
MTEPTKQPAKPKKTQNREYVVLEGASVDGPVANLNPPNWAELGTFTATSETAAKRQAITKAGQRIYGPIVAIPSRSWRPSTPKVTAQTVLKIEGV